MAIAIGIISLIAGTGLYIYGTNLNNNIENQIVSFFQKGVTNP